MFDYSILRSILYGKNISETKKLVALTINNHEDENHLAIGNAVIEFITGF